MQIKLESVGLRIATAAAVPAAATAQHAITTRTTEKTPLMTKYIYTILLISMIIATPTTAYAEPVTDEMEHMQTPNVTVVEGSQLRVTNGNGQTLRVYNVTGVHVRVFNVDGMDKCYDLNLPKGCYIIKIGKTVRKISIR